MSDESILADLKGKIENIRSEVMAKEGEKKALLTRLKKEFGVKDIKDAYDRLRSISDEIESKQERKRSLLQTAQERLENYE